MTIHEGGLGRETPTDWTHVEKYPLMAPREAPLVTCEKTLKLPSFFYRGQHNQWDEGACVGFGESLMMTLLNKQWYNPWWLWDRAKERDYSDQTNPGDGDGTWLAAANDVLRDLGHVRQTRWVREYPGPQPVEQLNPKAVRGHGIQVNRWAKTVDDMRAVMALGIPMAIGVNWYGNFDAPIEKRVGPRSKEFWIGEGWIGSMRGGHCVCVYGGSDRRQAFKLANSWGKDYPPVWLPYSVMQRLIDEDGEVSLVTDLPDAA